MANRQRDAGRERFWRVLSAGVKNFDRRAVEMAGTVDDQRAAGDAEAVEVWR